MVVVVDFVIAVLFVVLDFVVVSVLVAVVVEA
jgi:hypothetical protein